MPSHVDTIQAPGAGEAELVLDGLAKRFGRRRVFEGVSAATRAGECLVITGANGSGKSTLLAIIAGLLRPSKGKVILRLNGQELGSDERRSALGLVAPDLALYHELTGAENLAFVARLQSRVVGAKEMEELLERVGLPGRGGDRVGQYSSGMRVRLKYAAALLHQPRFLLLDEPTANLDLSGVAIVESVIEEQRRRGIVILATNEPDETRFADQRVDLTPAPQSSSSSSSNS
jgi:heme exporter protein A